MKEGLKAKSKFHLLKKDFKKINCGEKSIIIFVSIFALILIISMGCFIWTFAPLDVSKNIGDWGNYSMCLGAIFTFVSVLLIYVTYRKQSEAYNEQANSTYKMQFDSTFFNLLNIQRQIHIECLNRKFKTTYNGNEKEWFDGVFSFIKNEIKIKLNFLDNSSALYKIEEAKQKVCNVYTDATMFKVNKSNDYLIRESHEENDIMHYFRNLYHIIKHINESFLSGKDKKKYIDLIQAQMNDEELLVMLFNVIHYTENNTNKAYFTLLDNYKFFENLRSPHDKSYYLIKPLFRDTNLKHIKQPKSNQDV